MTPMDLQALVLSTMSRAEERIKTASEDMGMMDKMDGKKPKKETKKDETDEKKEVEKLASQVDQIIESLDSLSPTTSALSKLARKAGESSHVPNELAKSESLSRNATNDNEHRDAMAVGEDPGDPSSKVPGKGGNVPNQLKNTLNETPGGKALSTPPLVNKAASFKQVLDKLAETVPNELNTWTADQSGRGQSGWDASGYGNENRHLIESNESAMNYTKADAKKKYIKSQVGQVFDEVHPEKDTALKRHFNHGVDTAKMAGAMDAAKRGVELLAGGKKMPVMVGNRVKDIRPGNHLGQLGHATNRSEAMKSMATRAGVGTAVAGAGYGASQMGSDKTANAAALLGTAASAAGLGAYGYSKGRELAESGSKMDDMSLGGMLLAPLHYGAYRVGKEVGHAKNYKPATQKLAEALEKGCTCGGKGSCDYCKSKEVMKKIADMVNQTEAAPAMTGEVSPDPTQMGQDPQAQAQEKLPGCECNQGQDGMPLCKVCKLQALMEQYMAQKAEQEQGGADPAMAAGSPEVPGRGQPVQGLPQ